MKMNNEAILENRCPAGVDLLWGIEGDSPFIFITMTPCSMSNPGKATEELPCACACFPHT